MPRELKIIPVLNGFIVSVGCQTVVFPDPQSLGVAVARYYTSPDEVEKEYLSKPVNKIKMDGPLCPSPSNPPECAGQPADSIREHEPRPTIRR